MHTRDSALGFSNWVADISASQKDRTGAQSKKNTDNEIGGSCPVHQGSLGIARVGSTRAVRMIFGKKPTRPIRTSGEKKELPLEFRTSTLKRPFRPHEQRPIQQPTPDRPL